MRILHFSDIHAGGWNGGAGFLFDKRILGVANFWLRRKWRVNWDFLTRAVRQIPQHHPDLVICTGDLASVSAPSEFEQALDALRPLVHHPDFDFLYLPGNHDRYVADPACVEAGRLAFEQLNRNRWTGKNGLPACYTYNGLDFILVNHAAPSGFLSSAGQLDAPSRKWLESFFAERTPDQNKKTVLLGHYPLLDSRGRPLSARRGCHNMHVLQQAYREGKIRLSLCGHIHTPFCRQDGDKQAEYAAGSLTTTGIMNELIYTETTDNWEQKWIRI